MEGISKKENVTINYQPLEYAVFENDQNFD